MGPSIRRSLGGRFAPCLLVAVLGVAASACGTADTGEPEVFFTTPTDGATVTSPFQVEMGARNIEIGAVPEEVVEPRSAVIHYHVAANSDCLPPGVVIPQADPWIHFGDGSNEIEMNLPPGQHRLTVQAGDDEHRTIEGLCQVISVTVVEEGEP
jgi:hypothetical protein